MTLEDFIGIGNHYAFVNNMHKDVFVKKFAMEELKLSEQAANEMVLYEAQDDTEFDYDKFYLWYVVNVMANAIDLATLTKSHNALRNIATAIKHHLD